MSDTAPAGDLDSNDYDEFQFLESHARWAGLEWAGRPPVTRKERSVGGHTVSWIEWGAAPPDLVLLHGAGQNAHTWDTLAMATERPAVAIDLPGHGRSQWRDDGDYTPDTNAATLAVLLEQIAPEASAVVGMSLGGLTTIRLASTRPDLVRAAVVVDISPSRPAFLRGNEEGEVVLPERSPLALMQGPRRYESWDEMLDEAHSRMQHRTRDSLIPGLRHNARRHDDGSWGWRYDRPVREGAPRPDHEYLWDDLANITAPVMFAVGGNSPFVDDEARAEITRRRPSARLEVVDGAGHAVQNDKPVELAALIEDFLA